MSKLPAMKWRYFIMVPVDHPAAEGLTHGSGNFRSVLAITEKMREWEADSTAKLMFGPNAYAKKSSIPSRAFVRDQSWAKELFWSRPTKYGMMYWCFVCERKTKGYGAEMHKTACPFNSKVA